MLGVFPRYHRATRRSPPRPKPRGVMLPKGHNTYAQYFILHLSLCIFLCYEFNALVES